jgi:hypothetical protein
MSIVFSSAKENHNNGGSFMDTSSIPEEVFSELEELGVDTWIIIQAIISEFKHVFKKN